MKDLAAQIRGYAQVLLSFADNARLSTEHAILAAGSGADILYKLNALGVFDAPEFIELSILIQKFETFRSGFRDGSGTKQRATLVLKRTVEFFAKRAVTKLTGATADTITWSDAGEQSIDEQLISLSDSLMELAKCEEAKEEKTSDDELVKLAEIVPLTRVVEKTIRNILNADPDAPKPKERGTRGNRAQYSYPALRDYLNGLGRFPAMPDTLSEAKHLAAIVST